MGSARCVSLSGRALLAACGLALCSLKLSPACALGNDNRSILQWFENSWSVIEYRAPDLFVTGYGGVWLPPPSLASFGSPGYDPFDRFNLGQPGNETIYGTEADMRAMITELKRADTEVYFDIIMNHNGGRTSNAAFIADGGWPGFYFPGTTVNFWGDFHSGQFQSMDPSGANYNLFEGDLVGLIDINQSSNFQFIRHPIGPDSRNIPPGNFRNRPDPANTRFYPDRQLTPRTFVNPAPRGDGATWTIYPFNTANPAAGDPVVENATALLMRWCQWMLDDLKVDGFRLDAAKHIPQWFWNNFYDPTVFGRRQKPDGTFGTPFSFGESVAGNDFVQTYIRIDGFGYRDALDLNEAGQLRNILNEGGFNTWQNAVNNSIDIQDDGFNNRTQGVGHVFSHDNGSVGNGSSAPALPDPSRYGMPQNAYVLFKSAHPLVFFNAREMHTRFTNRGFWPREGNPTALGDLDQNLRRLVQVANGHARGNFFVRNSTDPVNTSLADVLIFERGNGVVGNVIVAVNDRNDAGFQTRSVATSFPQGTRLRELSGNASDPVVDPNDSIADTIVVGAGGRITINIPNNTSVTGVAHHRGYVVYGPAAPAGTLSFRLAGGNTLISSEIPADGASVPSWRRRNTPMTIISAPSFEIRLDTTKADPLDSNFDDFAVFRVNAGFVDLNGNGSFDMPASGLVDGGYERFLTQSNPISGPGGTGTVGTYRQVINTAQLPEGPNYVSAIAYRRRTDGGLPIYNEFRRVIYVDRLPPQAELLDSQVPIGGGNFEFRVRALDRTVNRVHLIPNLPAGQDPIAAVNDSNAAFQYDRFEWRRNVGNLPAGTNSLTLVAFELSGNSFVQRYENIQVLIGSGDVDGNGLVTIDDLTALLRIPVPTPSSSPQYSSAGDMNRNGQIDLGDRAQLEQTVLRAQELLRMRGPQR